MSYSIQCVHCQAILKSPVPVPGGKTVKCPKCKQAFKTPESAPPEEPPAPAVPNMEIPDPTPPPEELVEPDEEVVETDMEEVDDDEPRSTKKRKRDEDEDDKPRTTKKRKREQDEPPRAKKKKKKKAGGSMTLMAVLLGGGLLGLCLCCSCGGGGGYWYFFSNPVAGRWEPTQQFPGAKMHIEFGRFGNGHVHIEGFDRRRNNEKRNITMHFTYRLTGRNPMLLETKVVRIDGADELDALFWERDRASVDVVTFEGDTMSLRRRDGFAVPVTFRRAR